MGTYAHVWLDGVHLGKIRNDLDGNLLSVFRASDKKVAESLPAVAPEFMQYIADELGNDDDLKFVWYSIPVSALRNRLNVLGYTAEASRKAFEIALEEEKKSNARYASARRERVQDPPEMVSHAERQAAALDMLDVDVWLHAVRTASQDSAATPFPELSKDITPEAIEYARGRAWFGYPGPDLLVVVSLALEALPDSCELICDVTDFVATEDFDGEEYTSRVGDHTGEYDSAAKIVVLTEGKTDARVLKESLEILHPELIQYYSFLQFEDMRVSGGAGNLANLVKAFAAAGIANRVVAIFDNDTAGHASSQSLEGLALPPHIKVFKLPDLPLLERYPTMGPGGMAELNVNGVAASIELYMGDDVLRGHDGQLMPVQWTGYDRGLGRYQGEVMEKARLHERFNQKLVRARSLSKMELDDSWSGLETVLHVIFGAFQDLSAQEIADFTRDYYEITR